MYSLGSIIPDKKNFYSFSRWVLCKTMLCSGGPSWNPGQHKHIHIVENT